MPDSWNPPYQDIIPPLLRLRGYYSFLLLLYTQLFSFPLVYSPIFSSIPSPLSFLGYICPFFLPIPSKLSFLGYIHLFFLTIPTPFTFSGYIHLFFPLYPTRSLSLGIFAYFPFLYPAGLPSSGYNLPVFAFCAPLSRSSRGLASFFDSLCPVLSIFPGPI